MAYSFRNESVVSAQYALDIPGFNHTGDMTCSVWYLTTSLPGSRGMIARWEGFAAANRSFVLCTDAAHQPSFVVSGDGTNSSAVTDTSQVKLNYWEHLAGVYKASSFIRLFRNGIRVGEVTASIPGSLFNSPFDPAIGGSAYRRTSEANSWRGLLSCGAIWTESLSDSEIATLSVAGLASDPMRARPSALFGYWPLVNHTRDLVRNLELKNYDSSKDVLTQVATNDLQFATAQIVDRYKYKLGEIVSPQASLPLFRHHYVQQGIG